MVSNVSGVSFRGRVITCVRFQQRQQHHIRTAEREIIAEAPNCEARRKPWLSFFERLSVGYCHSLQYTFGHEVGNVNGTPPEHREGWRPFTHQPEQYDGPHAYKRMPSSKAAVAASNNCTPHKPLEACLFSDSGARGKVTRREGAEMNHELALGANTSARTSPSGASHTSRELQYNKDT